MNTTPTTARQRLGAGVAIGLLLLSAVPSLIALTVGPSWTIWPVAAILLLGTAVSYLLATGTATRAFAWALALAGACVAAAAAVLVLAVG